MAERSSTFDNYSALENPIGIETWRSTALSRVRAHYSALENPIGIETSSMTGARSRTGSNYSALENPIGIETR